jgi:hypothetical protein
MLVGPRLHYKPRSCLQFNLLTPVEERKLRLVSTSRIDVLRVVHTQLFLLFVPKANF